MLRAQSNSNLLAAQLETAYGQFPFIDRADWADLHVQIRRAAGVRRWLRPQVILHCDGQQPFDPFPSDSPLPLFEWGCNWLIGRRLNDLLLLHDDKGELVLIQPDPKEYKELSRSKVSRFTWAHPAVVDGVYIIRDEKNLLAIELPKK